MLPFFEVNNLEQEWDTQKQRDYLCIAALVAVQEIWGLRPWSSERGRARARVKRWSLCFSITVCLHAWCSDRIKSVWTVFVHADWLFIISLWGLSGLLAKCTWPECSNHDKLCLLWAPSSAFLTHACSAGTATPSPERVSFVQRRM